MKSKASWDTWGTWASALCAVHCALTGFAVGLLSIAGLGFMSSPLAEATFIGAAFVLGSVAVVHGVRRHHSTIPALIFVLGLLSIGLAHVAFDHGHPLATAFSILGGLSLIGFHAVNIRLQKGCSCNACEHRHP